MAITVGSLFSGIGGLDLGLERAGMNVIWQSEIDPYASKVLKKHWPDVPNYGDIKTIDWSQIERPNIICGGYPCQPFSLAGKRAGTDDPRHLWPWVRQAISELRPDYAILENVRGHLSMGGTTVIGEIAAIGYDAEWRIISAAGVGAPHRRDRVFIVAYPNGSNPADGRKRSNVSGENQSGRNDRSGSGSDFGQISLGSPRPVAQTLADANDARSRTPRSSNNVNGSTFVEERQNKPFIRTSGRGKNVADANRRRCEKCQPKTEPSGGFNCGCQFIFGQRTNQNNYIGDWWQIEPGMGRMANGIPARVDRLKGLGNAVVPQVAEYVGRLVMEAYKNDQK